VFFPGSRLLLRKKVKGLDTERTIALPESQSIQDQDLQSRIKQVFDAQLAYRQQVGIPDYAQRLATLKKLRRWILSNRPAIGAAVHEDFNKPFPETEGTEIYPVIAEINHALRHLRKWTHPHRVGRLLTIFTAKAYVQYEPKGVVLIVAPWNYPFMLNVEPLVSALAAGNSVILKPSELAPHTSGLIADMVDEIFEEHEVAVFEGDKHVAIELLKQPFDHVFFTGSTAVGKLVMQAAAQNLTSVTLELGGKSPVIVDETADLADAAVKIAWGKFANSGQSCIAPDYIFIHHTRYDEWIAEMRRAICKEFGDTPAAQKQSPNYARIINESHVQRMMQLRDRCIQLGGKIEIGGEIDITENFVAPTVVSDVDKNCPIMQEEIFGPLLPVFTYRDLREPLRYINSKDKPLALYIFSHNKKNISTILNRTSAGGSCINDVLVHYIHINLPFGGVRHSGMGSAHGVHGFKAFSHERAVMWNTSYSPIKLLYPPYTKLPKRLIDLLIKYF
jgi:aldehyde dehydrogenase (NAD+)